MRYYFTDERLAGGLWRVPFLCGVLVSASGFYLRHKVRDRERIEPSGDFGIPTDGGRRPTPLQLAFSRRLRRSLLCATAAVCLWAGGFYILFVWLVIFMRDLVEPPVEMPFAINAMSLSLTMVVLFPFAGRLSDARGRRPVMMLGAAGVAALAPPAMGLVAAGDPRAALAAQLALGACLCLYGAPLCAFLVECFPPESRLTSVAVGYNAAMAVAGGLSPALATKLVLAWGPVGAGYLLSALAAVSLCGVHLTPEHDYKR